MELTVSKSELLNAIARVMGAVSKRPASPVLSHLLVEACRDGRLILSATDLMVYARTECAALVDAGALVAVPAEKLSAAVDKSGEEVQISLKNGLKLHLDSAGRHFEMACLDADGFPVPLTGDPLPMYVLGHCVFPGLVKGLKHAVCGDETRYNLCGIHLISNEGRVTAYATDGKRLSIAGKDIPGSEHAAFAVTVPTRACSMLSDINSTIELSLATTGNLVRFCSGKNDISARLIDGDYPDVRKVIPSSLGKGCTVSGQALVEALEAGLVMSDDEYKSVQITANAGVLSLTTLGVTGAATVTIPYMGDDDISLRMNSRFLIQAAKSLGGGELFLRFKDDLSPIVIVPVDHGPWDERLEVIMPLRG